MNSIDRLIQRIQASQTLSDTQKARLIAMCERLKLITEGIRSILRSFWAWALAHRALVKVLALSLLLALILNQIPIVGQVLATMAIIVGAVFAILKQMQADFESLLGTVQ